MWNLGAIRHYQLAEQVLITTRQSRGQRLQGQTWRVIWVTASGSEAPTHLSICHPKASNLQNHNDELYLPKPCSEMHDSGPWLAGCSALTGLTNL